MRRAGPRAALLSLVTAAVLVAGCSESEDRGLPDPEEFASGPCRDAAPTVLAVDEQVRGAVGDDVDTATVRAALQAGQARLQELLPQAGEVHPQLEEVVARLGFARAALDTDSIDDTEVADVTAAVDDFVAVCVPAEGLARP